MSDGADTYVTIDRSALRCSGREPSLLRSMAILDVTLGG